MDTDHHHHHSVLLSPGSVASPPPPTTYILRENPKKTSRFLDLPDSPSHPCHQCGKRYRSWRTLFNHISSHPTKNPPPPPRYDNEQLEAAITLIMLSTGINESQLPFSANGYLLFKKLKIESSRDGNELGRGRYECVTCKKSFHSHQALGGHRARSKKVDGYDCSGLHKRHRGNAEAGLPDLSLQAAAEDRS